MGYILTPFPLLLLQNRRTPVSIIFSGKILSEKKRKRVFRFLIPVDLRGFPFLPWGTVSNLRVDPARMMPEMKFELELDET